MASILKVDELRGIVSAGDITITSEGGSATQSLQQGLAKQWADTNTAGTTLNDSLNVSSLTDNGAGDQTITMTNAMNNATYSVNMSNQIEQAAHVFLRATATPKTTTVFRTGAYFSGYIDVAMATSTVGDLA